MRIAVPRETGGDEPRVAATPESIKKFKSLGADIAVARGAGIASGIPDSEFEAAAFFGSHLLLEFSNAGH